MHREINSYNFITEDKFNYLSDLEKYEAAIEILARASSSCILQNNNVLHAAIVTKKIIELSKHKIVIFEDNLNGDISDQINFLDVLRNAPKEGKKLQIVVKDFYFHSGLSRNLKELASLYPERVEIRQACQSFLAEINKVTHKIDINDGINFIIGDEKAFRLEFPNSERGAFFSFNNLRIAQTLLDVFNKRFNECQSLLNE